jgi:hypothetical protein
MYTYRVHIADSERAFNSIAVKNHGVEENFELGVRAKVEKLVIRLEIRKAK